MDPDAGSRLEVGRVGRAHGLKGEVAVTLTSNRSERLEPGARLYAGDRALDVRCARPHRKRWLVQFVGVDDRTAAEALLGTMLLGDPHPDAPDGEVWIHELIGAEVVNPVGDALGRVVSVEANPAHDLLVLDGGALVPMVFVVDTVAGRVVIDPPDGLLDLNPPAARAKPRGEKGRSTKGRKANRGPTERTAPNAAAAAAADPTAAPDAKDSGIPIRGADGDRMASTFDADAARDPDAGDDVGTGGHADASDASRASDGSAGDGDS